MLAVGNSYKIELEGFFELEERLSGSGFELSISSHQDTPLYQKSPEPKKEPKKIEEKPAIYEKPPEPKPEMPKKVTRVIETQEKSRRPDWEVPRTYAAQPRYRKRNGEKVPPIVTVDDLAQAIHMSFESNGKHIPLNEARDIAFTMKNVFGYNNEIVANSFGPDEKALANMLEDAGLVKYSSEETTLFDGREWRIFYCTINVERVKDIISGKEKKADKKIKDAIDTYKELPDDVWERKSTGAAS